MNIEPYLTYKKLHRTGRLLKSLSVQSGIKTITLKSTAPYASSHELGEASDSKVLQSPYVTGDVNSVKVGGNITARPFMKPSPQVLRSPRQLIETRIKRYGWT